jgi:uncharacterized membrane protein YkvI
MMAAQNTVAMSVRSSLFQRLLLPGFAFKAVVIGGGYATGRELAEFFLPCGPRAGLLGIGVAMLIWSIVCATTFVFARATHSNDYRSFFRQLLGPAWPTFEIAYFALIVLVLSVFGAAAGAIGHALLGTPAIAGTLCLMAVIALTVRHGNDSVERVFKYVSLFLYAVYALFLVLCLSHFGADIRRSLLAPAPAAANWLSAGVSYAGYNVVGAISILPVVRHMTSTRDAVTAGLLCGPLAMLPAMLFFICMSAFYPQIAQTLLPSDFMLGRLGLPVFRAVFQLMIFCALWESGTGCLNAVNQRVANACQERGRSFAPKWRVALSTAVMIGAIFLASRFGLAGLIAKGYRGLTILFLIVYIVPLLTYGVYRLAPARQHQIPAAGPAEA